MTSQLSEVLNEIFSDEAEVIAAVKDGHIVAFSATEAALSQLAFLYGKPETFDVVTADGMKAAKTARKELVSYRTALEAKRKELKAPILARGKLLDDEAKRITGELLKIEQPLDAHITAEENRAAEAEALAAKIEAERVAGLQSRLARIREVPQSMIGAPLNKMRVTLSNLEGLNCADFAEFEKAAYACRDASINALQSMIGSAELAERQAAELEEAREKQAVADRENAELRAKLAAAEAAQVAPEPAKPAVKPLYDKALFGADFVRDIEPATTALGGDTLHGVPLRENETKTFPHLEDFQCHEDTSPFYEQRLSQRQIIKAVSEFYGIGEDDAEQEIISAFCN